MSILKSVLTAAILAGPALLAQPADAGVAGCASAHISIFVIRPADFVNCTFDSIGDCIYFYDPLFPPFPNQIVPETTQLAFCIPL